MVFGKLSKIYLYFTIKPAYMNVGNLKIYKTDIAANQIQEIKYSDQEDDFHQYINGILSAIIKNEKSRRYRFLSDAAEMYTLVNRCVSGERFKESAERAARRLMEEEKKAQQ